MRNEPRQERHTRNSMSIFTTAYTSTQEAYFCMPHNFLAHVYRNVVGQEGPRLNDVAENIAFSGC